MLYCHTLTDLPPAPTLPPVTMSFNDAAEMSSLTRLLRQHKPRPSDTQPVPPRTKQSNSDGKGMNIKFTASFNVSFLEVLYCAPIVLLSCDSLLFVR